MPFPGFEIQLQSLSAVTEQPCTLYTHADLGLGRKVTLSHDVTAMRKADSLDKLKVSQKPGNGRLETNEQQNPEPP